MATIHCHVQVEQALDQLGLKQGSTPCTPGSAFGEANVGANVGVGDGEIYRDKVGVTLNFRTLKAGTNITIGTAGDEVTINSTAGGGNVIGPTPPAEPKSIATFADATGLILDDNLIRIDTASGGAILPARAIQARDDEVSPKWHDLIAADKITGVEVIVGNVLDRIVVRAVQDVEAEGSGGRGRIIQEKISVDWEVEKAGSIYLPTEPNTKRIFRLGTGGTSGSKFDIYCGSIDPQGAVAAAPGSLYVRGDVALSNASIYQHQGTTVTNSDWVEVGFKGVITASDVIIDTTGVSPPWDNVQDSIKAFGMAGTAQHNSPHISDAGSGQINVQSGYGFFRATDNPELSLYAGGWPPSSGISIPTGTIRYVGAEYNAGSPQVTVRTSENFNGHTDFRLGTVVNEGGTLHILNNPQYCSDFGERTFHRFFETFPLKRADRLGGIIPAGTGVRYLTVSIGELYDGFNEFVISAIDTSGTDTFDSYYRDGSGGWTKTASQSQWDNANYDDGTGTLNSLGVGKYGIHWLYIEADSNLVLLYGQDQYNTAAEAELASVPATVPLRITAHGRLLGRLIFQQGASSPLAVDNVWDEVFTGSASGGDVFGPTSASDEAVARFDTGTGKLIQNSTVLIDDTGHIYAAAADTTSPVGLKTTGTNGGTARIYIGDRSPEGNVSAAPGAFYIKEAGSESRLYQHRGTSTGSTGWVDLTAVGGGTAVNIGFYAYRTGSNQTLSTGVETTVGMNNVRDDAGSDFTTSLTDSYFTCPTAGRYVFSGSLELTLAAAGRGETRLYSSVHGRVAESSDHENTAGTVKPSISTVLYCDQNEVIRLKAWQNSGFTATIQLAYSHFSGAQIVQV